MSLKHTDLVVDFKDTKIAFEHKPDDELKKAAWMFRMMNNPSMVKLGSSLGLKALSWGVPFAESIVKNTIFEQFCGGISLIETQKTINRLFEHKTLTILDYGAEAKKTEHDFNKTMSETLAAIDFGATNVSVPVVSAKITGMARFALLEKIQNGKELIEREKKEWKNVLKRVDVVCHHAWDKKVGIFFDAEESWIQDAIDGVVNSMMEKYNQTSVIVYNTYQMYRHDRLEYLMSSFEDAKRKGYFLGAKLVRGAYMEKERERAEEMKYDSPIQPDKKSTDNDYNSALQFCIENYDSISSCNATHNEFSNYFQAELIDQLDIPNNHPHINFCQLYGMSDHITFNLAKGGFNAAKYVPYGAVKEVIPYLIRRANENTSMTGEMSRELKLIKQEIKRRRI